MNERAQNLFLITDHFIETHRAWVHDEDTRWITEGYEQSIRELFEIWEVGDVPAECRQLESAIAALHIEYDSFVTRARSSRNPDVQLPGIGYDRAVGEVEKARLDTKPKRKRVLETIPDLVGQKVPSAQICLIYEWTDPDGSPQLWKLQEELAEPGKHTVGYVPPSHRRREQAEQHEAEVIARIRAKHASKVKRQELTAPESLEELIRQGLSVRQIGKMKKLGMVEIYKAADAAGLARPPLEYNPRDAQAPQTPDDNESQQRIKDAIGKSPAPFYRHDDGPQSEPASTPADDDADDAIDDADPTPGPMTIDQEIVQYHKEGYEPAAIAAMLTNETDKITPQKVGKVIAKYRDNPSAFESIGG